MQGMRSLRRLAGWFALRFLLAIERARALGARLWAEAVLSEKFEIRLDAEPRSFRQQEIAVLEANGNGRGAIAQCALRLHLLEDEKIRDRCGKMHCRGGADRSARIVRCDR